MQVTNEGQITSYTQTTKTTKSNDTENSFESLLQTTSSDTNNIDVIDYSTLGKYSEYAKEYNLSQEELETFKNILDDEKITFKELENLSFEKAEKLTSILNDRVQAGEDDSLVTFIKTMDNQHVSDILSATKMTNNKELNETLYNTMINTTDDNERSTILHGVQNDLVRTNSNISSNVEFAINKNSIEIDTDKFLEDMRKYHEENLKEALKNPDILPEAIAQYQEKIDVYDTLISTYNNTVNNNSGFYA